MAARAKKATRLSRETRATLQYARRSLLQLRHFIGTRPAVMQQADVDAIGRVQRALDDMARNIEGLAGRRWPPRRKPAPKFRVLAGGRA